MDYQQSTLDGLEKQMDLPGYDNWKLRSPDDEYYAANPGEQDEPEDEPEPDEKPRIVTVHEYPPIPIRSFDWCAYREGREENGGYGWGPTEEAAIADLLSNEEDE